MKTKAAALTGVHRDWEVLEFDLDDPGPGEVLVQMKVAGLCHSDKHAKFGGMTYPLVGGHEGAGVVEAVGDGVSRVSIGDHVAVSWIPSCGTCRWCASGQSNLCDLGANMVTGELANGGFRFHRDGTDIGAMAATGTFSQFSVVDQRSVVKVDPTIPFEWVSLVTCGVATGWGSVVNAGEVKAGDTVAVYGCGGIGSNAVRAAVGANAGLVAAIDPVESKLEFAKQSGADFVYTSAEEAHADLWERTYGVGADVTVVTVGVVTSEVVRAAFELTRKGGTVVLTGVSDDVMENTIELPGGILTLFQKRIVGSLYGHCNPLVDIPRLLRMAQAGKLVLDDLVTRRYALEDINQGFDDMLAGHNIRGLIVHDH
ncbi:alcohol dehydrogenase (plasmid) [Rhodococcus jostii RHA1]|uniref:alcohol dehydrogenase n=1 Tax=Rhodococcus jostii (strain RHA1) TaxID=101510 RepID=Q0RV69_RHOJR|nr:Zn-dependent alcohol dehydrogenase [Rhodococcus jostii]ABH00817.1 alcohol dehydrogenase [Rhodococcus jostii RHA1]